MIAPIATFFSNKSVSPAKDTSRETSCQIRILRARIQYPKTSACRRQCIACIIANRGTCCWKTRGLTPWHSDKLLASSISFCFSLLVVNAYRGLSSGLPCVNDTRSQANKAPRCQVFWCRTLKLTPRVAAESCDATIIAETHIALSGYSCRLERFQTHIHKTHHTFPRCRARLLV